VGSCGIGQIGKPPLRAGRGHRDSPIAAGHGRFLQTEASILHTTENDMGRRSGCQSRVGLGNILGTGSMSTMTSMEGGGKVTPPFEVETAAGTLTGGACLRIDSGTDRLQAPNGWR